MLTDLLYRLRSLFRRNAVEGELDEELRFHFNEQVEKFVRSGLDRAEAVRRARLAFGGVEQVKEECREARGVFTLETLLRDLGYALRMWRKNPGFALAAMTAIGLGIGANTAMFTIFSRALSFDPGIDNPDRVVLFSPADAIASEERSWSGPVFQSLRSSTRSLAVIAAYRYTVVNVSDKAALPERFSCAQMTASGFSIIGRRP